MILFIVKTTISTYPRLNDTIPDNEISISGYKIVRRDRPLNGRNGGGVCFYVRSNTNYIVREDQAKK